VFSFPPQEDLQDECLHRLITLIQRGLRFAVSNFRFFLTLRKANIRFVMSVCLSACRSVRPSVPLTALNNSVPTGWMFMKSHICVFYRKSGQKIQSLFTCDKNKSTVHENMCIYVISLKSSHNEK